MINEILDGPVPLGNDKYSNPDYETLIERYIHAITITAKPGEESELEKDVNRVIALMPESYHDIYKSKFGGYYAHGVPDNEGNIDFQIFTTRVHGEVPSKKLKTAIGIFMYELMKEGYSLIKLINHTEEEVEPIEPYFRG